MCFYLSYRICTFFWQFLFRKLLEKNMKNDLDVQKELSNIKYGAAWCCMMNLSDYIKFSGIAKAYFNKSSQWIHQRLHGYMVNGKEAQFTEDEYKKFSDALRDIAAKLNKAADDIDKAKHEPLED